MKYLLKEYILHANKRTIEKDGGTFYPPNNLLNENALDYLVGMVEHEDYYPNIEQKAALYAFNITKNHIFGDGNKRTALLSMLAFLRINGFEFNRLLPTIRNEKTIPNCQVSTTDGILECFITEIADGTLVYEDVVDFILKNMIVVP